jgi:hypothetical protein
MASELDSILQDGLSEGWSEGIARVIDVGNRTKDDVLKQETKLLLLELVRLTPPTGNAPFTENFSDQKQAGENAIKGDIMGRTGGSRSQRSIGLFYAAPAAFLRNKPSANTVKLFAKKDGTVYGVEKKLFQPNASIGVMSAHHQRFRTANGRVSTAGALTRDVGRWKFIDKMVVSKGALASYMRVVRGRVGMAKSGWVTAARNLGVTLQAWINRHSQPGEGTLDLRGNDESSITISNLCAFAQKHGRNLRIVQRAIDRRTDSMNHRMDSALGKAFEGYK